MFPQEKETVRSLSPSLSLVYFSHESLDTVLVGTRDNRAKRPRFQVRGHLLLTPSHLRNSQRDLQDRRNVANSGQRKPVARHNTAISGGASPNPVSVPPCCCGEKENLERNLSLRCRWYVFRIESMLRRFSCLFEWEIFLKFVSRKEKKTIRQSGEEKKGSYLTLQYRRLRSRCVCILYSLATWN